MTKFIVEKTPYLEYAGISDFPKPDTLNKKRLMQKRKTFYQTLAKEIPRGLVYYPASGSDPIPFQVFGERVIYSSLDDGNYFKMLKDPSISKPPLYEDEIRATSNLDRLRAIYADIQKTPLSNAVCKAIIMCSTPPNLLTVDIFKELVRILESGGLLVFETESDLKKQKRDIDTLMSTGYFIPHHNLDRFGGLTEVSYFGYPDNGIQIYQMTPNGKQRLMTDITREEFIESLRNGKTVSMAGHIFRVFQKVTK